MVFLTAHPINVICNLAEKCVDCPVNGYFRCFRPAFGYQDRFWRHKHTKFDSISISAITPLSDNGGYFAAFCRDTRQTRHNVTINPVFERRLDMSLIDWITLPQCETQFHLIPLVPGMDASLRLRVCYEVKS